MPPPPAHIAWLKDTGAVHTTACGKTVPIWEFQHQTDEDALSEWATHFRNNYCYDAIIDALRKGPNKERSEYLTDLVFPIKDDRLGRATRSGDFSEILVADYLEYVLNCTVPRERHRRRWNANVSTPGCDVIGYQLDDTNQAKDKLWTIEVKGSLSPTKPGAIEQFQAAITESSKDQERIGYSLNALRNVFLETNQNAKADEILRFQDPVSRPYQHSFSAALVVTEAGFDHLCVPSVTTMAHPFRQELSLLVIRGEEMMKLTHDLYERAAMEADKFGTD